MFQFETGFEEGLGGGVERGLCGEGEGCRRLRGRGE